MTPELVQAKPKRKHSKPLSLVAVRIVQEALNAEADLSSLSRLATSDPGFAARVVSMVNSGAFGITNRVSDVRQACSLLGVRGLRNLGLSLIVSDMIPTGADGDVLLVVSLRRAVAGKLLAQALGLNQVDEHFTTGLFLEIGLLESARGDLKGAAEVARMPAEHRPTLERAQGLPAHPASGAEVARKLRLPDSIIEAVASHHDPRPPESLPGKVAWAAERVAGAYEAGSHEHARKLAEEAMAAIGIRGNTAELLDRLPLAMVEAAVVFDRALPEQADYDSLISDANRRIVEMNQGYEKLVHQLERLLGEKEELTQQLQRANAELEGIAATDPLTGLANRRAFEEALRRDFSRADRTSTPISLLVLDIDFFKKVNDTHGHGVGDVVIQKVAGVLRDSVRTGDVAARIGGEEFVVLLPGTDAEGARVVAERIRLAVAAASVTGSTGPLSVTASLGLVACRGSGVRDGGKGAMERADAALYEAKRSGRNRVVTAK